MNSPVPEGVRETGRVSLTRPLGLESRLTPPDRGLDFVPLLNVLLLGLLFSLLGSRFVFPPGMSVELPRSTQAALPGLPAVAVLTARSDNVFLYNGRIHSLDTLTAALQDSRPERDAVLLLRLSREVTMQAFLQVCEAARRAGFSQVQIAAEVRPDTVTELEL